EQLDGEVAERRVGLGARDMREAALRVADLPVGQRDVSLGFSGNRVDEVGGADRNTEIGKVVIMKQRGLVPGDPEGPSAPVIIFEQRVVMRLVFERDGSRRWWLGAGRQRQKE